MKEAIDALILGIVQGISEFLPISSSGHIELAEALLGVNQEDGIWMTIVLHFATALATIVVYWKDILDIIKGVLQFKWNTETQFAFKIGLSMIPAVLAGLLLEDWLEEMFNGQVLLVGFMLIITALLLFLADKAQKTEKSVGIWDAIIIGISQAIAILPGISRSGATISTSVLLGIDREKSARFSFLMVIPVIFGVIGKKYLDWDPASGEVVNITALSIGFVSAFIVGIFACKWMIALVKKAQLKYFAYYCLVVGLIAITWKLVIH